MPVEDARRNTKPAKQDRNGSVEDGRVYVFFDQRALPMKNAVIEKRDKQRNQRNGGVELLEFGVRVAMERTMKKVTARPSKVRAGMAAAITSRIVREASFSEPPSRIFGSKIMESSGSSEDAVLAIAAGQERMAQQAMAAMLSAQPVVTMIARGWRSQRCRTTT